MQIDPAAWVQALGPAAELAGLEEQHRAAVARGDAATLDDVLGLLAGLRDLVVSQVAAPAERRVSLRDARVLELARQGMRDPEIAEQLGMTATAVRMARRRHGVSGQDPRPRRTGWEDRLRDAHSRGLTTDQIAAELGWSKGHTAVRLHELGLRAHRARGQGDRPLPVDTPERVDVEAATEAEARAAVERDHPGATVRLVGAGDGGWSYEVVRHPGRPARPGRAT